MEGDAGTSQLNPIDDQERSEAQAETVEPVIGEPDEQGDSDAPAEWPAESRRPEHFGRGWLLTICAVLVLATAAVGVGGFLAHRAHAQSATLASDDDVALARAKECVAATQAPDVAAISASQTKIIECGTGAFAVQSSLYASLLVDAYQAANVSVKVSDLRAAVERHNPDRSVDVLVALRVAVTNSQVANQEQGYRLRVQMAPADGTYKISELDQVAS